MKLNDFLHRPGDIDSEADLLTSLAAGHEPSFALIYDKYWKMVYQTANKLLQSSSLAQDIVQDVFSTVWVQRREVQHVANLEAYIRTMARNRIYSEFRAWSKERANLENYTHQLPTSVDDCDFNLLNRQNEQLLEQILHTLPPRQKEVFTLARKEGLSHEQIAEKLNLSSGTVKNHMVRALQTIRMHLESSLSLKVTSLIAFLLF